MFHVKKVSQLVRVSVHIAGDQNNGLMMKLIKFDM